ncbi:MAG TPA: ATP-binding protein [Caulobacteraceae bacterium]|jgi:PAS domain S-box-containing protein|nr:ATP-binding protein [Caulobacteraceae bacterium]
MKANKLHTDIYRSIVDTAGEVVIVANEQDQILQFDPTAVQKVFGYAASDLIGSDIRVLLPEMVDKSHAELVSRFRGRVEGPLASIDHSVEGRRKNGKTIPLELLIAEGRDKLGGRCFSWVMRDVTERVRLNAELSAIVEQASAAAEVERQLSQQLWISNEELKIANEGLQKFTSIVAHDLRSPLRRIEAFVGVLQKDFHPELNDEGRDILDRIANGTARMRLMLDSLLQYSRYNSTAIAGKIARLEDVIRDAQSAFDMDAIGVNVRVELGDVGPVKGDPVLLAHVLQNLIGNAVKFRSSKAPSITIEAKQTNAEISLSVTDNGIGIEPRFADKIFEMFYRLHDDDEYDGTGIGLTICRKIINDHGGQIWLDTGHKSGTRFVFTAPAASEADLMNDPAKAEAVAKARADITRRFVAAARTNATPARN